MDIFSTLTMLEGYKQAQKPETFLRDAFFKKIKEYDTAEIALDVKKRKKRMAPFVSSYLPGSMVERQGFSTNVFEAPYIKPFTRTNAEDFIKQRSFGELIGGNKNPMTRALEALGEDIAMLDEMIDVREEWMVAQLLFTGAAPIVGDGIPAGTKLEFWNASDADAPYTALSSANYWTASGSDPLAAIETGVKAVRAGSNTQPDTAILGADAASAFLKHEHVLKLLDNRRVEIGEIKPRDLPGGVSYLGRLAKHDLDLFTYDGSYPDDTTGTLTPYVPKDKVLFGSSRRPETTMAYGVVAFKDEKTGELRFAAERRVPVSRVEADPAGRIVQLMSRPLPIIHEVHSFHVAKVVA